MANEIETPDKPKRGRTRILLFVSLALNLLVIGVVAGAILRHDRGGHPPMRELGYGPYGQAFSPSDRREIARQMRDRAGDLRANRAEVRAQFKSMLTALRAVPFDGTAMRQLAEDQRAKLSERQNIGQALFLDRIESMDNTERATFADRLERSMKRRKWGRKRR